MHRQHPQRGKNDGNTRNVVSLSSEPMDVNMVDGRFPPQRISNESPDSNNLVILNDNRQSGSFYDFTVDTITQSVHWRKLSLARSLVPLPPQINPNNWEVKLVLIFGPDNGSPGDPLTVQFFLQPGYYTISGLVNEIEERFRTAITQATQEASNFSASYNPNTRSIRISETTPPTFGAFYIREDCSFARYARNVVSFPTFPEGTNYLTGVPHGTKTWDSTSCQMIYSRLYYLTSRRLVEDQRSYSLVSGRGPQNIVAIIDLVDGYDTTQFSSSEDFPRTQVVIDSSMYSPKINIVNRQKALKVCDFQVLDEFGLSLDNLDFDGTQPIPVPNPFPLEPGPFPPDPALVPCRFMYSMIFWFRAFC